MDQAVENTAGQFGEARSARGEETSWTSEPAAAPVLDGDGKPAKRVYAGREWTSDHSLNIRMSIPIGIGRYYITLVAGKERRARARLALDRRQNPLDTPTNVIFIATITTIATAGSITLLYLVLAHIFGWSGRLVL